MFAENRLCNFLNRQYEEILKYNLFMTNFIVCSCHECDVICITEIWIRI